MITAQTLPHPAVLPALTQPAISGHQGILAAAACGLEAFIAQQGGDPERILGMCRISPALLTQPTQSLTLPGYCRVLEEAARQTGADNFGLHYGLQFKPQQLGLIGYVGLCSATAEQALRNLVFAFPWHQHATLTRLVDLPHCLRFDYQIRHGAIISQRQDAELTLGMVINLLRHALGPQWAPKEVHFEHPRPEQWHEHCKYYDAPVYFDQPFNSLLIPRHELQRPMPESDPILLMVMQDAMRRLNQSSQPLSVLDQARAAIRQQLPQGEPVMEQVAGLLGMSGASLQRRLSDEQLTFSRVVDRVRQEMATHYLAQRHLPISDMAFLLGYSEVSAFSRAFRRWFGISPRAWRQQQDRP
ncbi:AraC family transcriptional regulator (plasmid) [Chimaeribacter arupi]|uniref:AraC family transcriptional regulator n=2 Tax=Yersiniaceae TaxID=1903411 RepID=A0A2N5EMJ2_9GAMM|nr:MULTISPECIES: AraC family transcriptional regulator [Yersiniaceae]MBS0968643.1 AraC family transcriptional regulator [Nissabacter archeti]PLR49278.1 AraC family transcriptional regulator [Chimaeribacter arupi]WKZ94618.1 AraC family transcriptional regulator [Chimaeribacter arupi]